MSAIVDFIPVAGESVYNEDGRQGEYVTEHDGAHIVFPMMRDEDDCYEPRHGQPEVWHEVYEKPPVPVVHEEVSAATAELDGLREEIGKAYGELSTIRAERAEYARDHAAVRERLKENEALRNIDAYLAGTITHFVTSVDYVPKIETFDKAIVRKENRNGKELRLLGLFGDDDRGVRWRVTTYGDGSGGSMSTVIPCLSLEEAQDRVRKILVEKTIPSLRSGKLGQYYGSQVVDLAAEMGVLVPDDLLAQVKAQRAQQATERLARARTEVERYAASLREAEAEARAAGVLVEGGAS